MDVYVTAAAPAGPTAEFTVTPTSGTSPLPVTVDASGSTYAVAAIDSYAWVFGDGQTGLGRTASHMYVSSSTQTYTITLTVTGADGKTGKATKQVRVTAPGGGTVAGNPSAQFVIETDGLGVAPLQVSFDPTDSEAANGRSLILYAWVYGDGVAESDPGAALKTHVFSIKTSSEVFSVRLLVMDNANASDSITKTVKVYNYRPVAGFEIANPPGGHGTGLGAVQYLTTGAIPVDVWEVKNVVYGNLGTLTPLTTVKVWIRSKAIVDAGGAGSTNRWFTLSGGPAVTQHNLRTATTSAVSGGAPSAPTGYTANNFSYDPEGQTWIGDVHPTWFPSLAGQAWGIKWLYINWGDASPIEQVPYVATGLTEDHDYPIANGPVYTITVTAEDYLGYQSAPFPRKVTLKTGEEVAGDI
jgi:PKD repeat protein